MKAWPLALLLSTAALAQSQAVNVAIKDVSALGSPVALSGTATAKDAGTGVLRYSLELNASAVNRSSKDIVLFIAQEDISGMSVIEADGPWSQDYFFSSETFRSGTAETFNHVLGPFGNSEQPEEPAPQQPHATWSIVFVQFIDGSTWGDRGKAKYALEERRLEWDMLRALQQVYRERGEAGFVSEMMKDTQLNVIYQLQQIYKANGNDAGTALRAVTRMLGQADDHSIAMKGRN